jgi:excisionase family DNA binding protein
VEKLLMKPIEFAEATGLSRSKAYDLLRRNEVPGVVRFGKSTRVSVEAVRQWIREQSEQPR